MSFFTNQQIKQFNILKKIAQDSGDPPPPPPKYIETPAKPAAANSSPSVSSAPKNKPTQKSREKNNSIVEMQKKMAEYRNVFASMAIGHEDFGRGDTTDNVGPDGYSMKRDLQGLRPLGQILLNDYIGSNNIKGVGFVDVDMQLPDRKTEGIGAQNPVSFANVIDTIGRFGTPNQNPKRKKTTQEVALEASLQKIYDKANNDAIAKIYKYNGEQLYAQPSNISDEYWKSLNDMQKADYHKKNLYIDELSKYKKNIDRIKSQLNSIKAREEAAYEKKYGKEKTEEDPDGIWDARTQNSLLNIAAITKGILNFSKDLNIKLSGYNDGYLSAFENVLKKMPPLKINQTYSPEDIKNITNPLIKHLTAQIKMVLDFKNKIFTNKDLNKVFNQQESLYDFSKTKSNDELTKERIAFLENNDDQEKNLKNTIGGGLYGTTYRTNDLRNYFEKYKNTKTQDYTAGMPFVTNKGQFIITLNDLSTFANLESLYKRINGTDPKSKKEIVGFINNIELLLNEFAKNKQNLIQQDFDKTNVPSTKVEKVRVPSALPWGHRTEYRYTDVPKSPNK